MNRARLLLLVLAGLALALCTGCGATLIPFTHELRTQSGLTDKDLQNLQFYVSGPITLRRELSSDGRQVTGNHKLVLVSGKTIEEVVVEEHTPGIAVAVHGGSIEVSFEPGTSLTFSAASEPGSPPPPPEPQRDFAEAPDPFPGSSSEKLRQPDPFPGGQSPVFGGTYWLSTGPGGRVTYQGSSFEAVEESLKAHLLIDAESLEEVVKNRKVLPGMRLPEKP